MARHVDGSVELGHLQGATEGCYPEFNGDIVLPGFEGPEEIVGAMQTVPRVGLEVDVRIVSGQNDALRQMLVFPERALQNIG